MTLTPEQIREAVELAEGFSFDECHVKPCDYIMLPEHDDYSGGGWHRTTYKPVIAALASQLKRQAYAMEPDLSITETTRYIHLSGPQGHILTIEGHEPDENSILACTEFLRGRK